MLNFCHHFNQAHSVISMAAAGHGVGVVAGLLLKSMNCRDVRILRIIDPVIIRDICVVVRSGATLSRPAKVLLEELKAAVLKQAAADF